MDIRDALFSAVYDIIAKDKNAIFLTADMGANDLIKIRNDFPEQYINMGVSEQNMVSVAAGLALSGKKVFIYTIAAFLQRAFEQIKVDICGMNLPVTIIGGCVGLSNATDGSTHHSINDISIMRTLPNLTIFNPCSAQEAKFCASYKSESPVYIRLDKGELLNLVYSDSLDTGLKYLGGKGRDDGSIIIATGVTVPIAMEVGYWVIDLFKLKPVNKRLVDLIKNTKRIITLEEHLNIGLGSIVAEILADNNLNIPLKRIGIDDRPCPVGSREYLQRFYGLDVESIKNEIEL